MNDHENNHDDYEHEPDNPIAPAASAAAVAPARGARRGLEHGRHRDHRRALWIADVAVQARGGRHLAARSAAHRGRGRQPLGGQSDDFRRGYICFSDSNKVIGERLLPVSQPMPDPSELPDKGFPWSQQWAVNLKCLDGADTGLEVVYKPTTVGGIQAIVGLVEEVRDRLNGKMHGGKVSSIVRLDKSSYTNSYGKIVRRSTSSPGCRSTARRQRRPPGRAFPRRLRHPRRRPSSRAAGASLNPDACIRRPYFL